MSPPHCSAGAQAPPAKKHVGVVGAPPAGQKHFVRYGNKPGKKGKLVGKKDMAVLRAAQRARQQRRLPPKRDTRFHGLCKGPLVLIVTKHGVAGRSAQRSGRATRPAQRRLGWAHRQQAARPTPRPLPAHFPGHTWQFAGPVGPQERTHRSNEKRARAKKMDLALGICSTAREKYT